MAGTAKMPRLQLKAVSLRKNRVLSDLDISLSAIIRGSPNTVAILEMW